MNKIPILAKLSFKLKIILAVSIITISIVTIILQVRSKQIDNILRDRMNFRTSVIADIIAFSINKGCSLDKTVISGYSEQILIEPEIAYVLFFDRNNKLISRAGNYNNDTVSFKTENIFKVKDDIYTVYKEIYGENDNKLGAIIVGFPMESLSIALHKHLITGITLWLAAVILIVVFIYYIITLFLKPLKSLYDAVLSAEQKDFDYKIPVVYEDEIGIISKQFNSMSDKLKDFYNGLEEQISKATGELVLSNKTLTEKSSELEMLNNKLIEMDKRKTEFVSIVSHDLKTPLTSIMGFTDTLLNKKLKLKEEDREEYLKIISLESRRLSRLISDFLDLSKIEEGVLKLNIENIDLKEIIDKVIVITNPESENVTISVTNNNDLVKISADSDRLSQVFHNLLSNALKYTPKYSEILITVESNSTENRISIADQGPGIHDSEKLKIFDKFYRIDDDMSRKERGTGLGLVIAKSIIELHGGKIWVEDNKPRGSRFIFTIPV